MFLQTANMIPTKVSQSGQILLITLLVFSVGLTVALGLIGRTTTDTTINSQIEESSRAFAAAEAGIESALKSGVGTGSVQTIAAGVTYNVNVTALAGGEGTFIFPRKTSRGQTETIWLANHDGTGALLETPVYTASSIDVCWSDEAAIPALEVTVLYKESADGSYRVLKGAYDPDGTRRSGAGGNQFSGVTSAVGGCGADTGTIYRQSLNFAGLNPTVSPVSDSLLMLRLKPIYSDAQLAVNPASGISLPVQGNRIESSGTTGSGVSRKIVVYQQYKAPLGIFDYGIYSQGDFVHQ